MAFIQSVRNEQRNVSGIVNANSAYSMRCSSHVRKTIARDAQQHMDNMLASYSACCTCILYSVCEHFSSSSKYKRSSLTWQQYKANVAHFLWDHF